MQEELNSLHKNKIYELVVTKEKLELLLERPAWILIEELG